MEREANLLRCAKLSCYAEFNRMVHAIARSSGEAGFQNMSGARMVVGTSTEYLFYTTLVSMLTQVVRNTNRASQQVELQQVYQWFCANKPLISQKQNHKTQRPKLSLSRRPADTLHRPQTAPAALLQPCPSPLPPQPHSRPHTAQPQHGFTSSYMSRSLSLSPHTTCTAPLSPSISRAATPSHTQRAVGNPRLAGRSVGPGGHKHHCVSLVEVPSQSLSADNLPLNMTTLLQLAPTVAATMEWQREVRQEQVAVMSNSVPSVDTPVHLEHTAEDTSRKELKRAAVTAGTEVTDLTLQPEDNSQAQPSDDNSLSPPQDHSSPTITVVTHPSPTHTITYSTRRTPVHVVTLDLSVGQQLSHTARHVPSRSGLKRSGSKVASGFNCSRYRPSSGKTDYYSGSSTAI